MSLKKIVPALALIGMVLAGCGSGDPPAKPVENPQKGAGASADGAANQAPPSTEAEAN